MALAHPGLQIAVLNPPDEVDGRPHPLARSERPEGGRFRPVSNDFDAQLAGPGEWRRCLEQHVHSFGRNEAADERYPQGRLDFTPWRIVESIGLDGVFRDVDRLGAVAARDLEPSATRPGNESRRRAARRSIARQPAMKAADVGKPFLLAGADMVEARGPRESPIERTQNEGDSRAGALRSERAGRRGTQRSQTMDDVELAGADTRTKNPPRDVLEVTVTEDGQRGERCPALVAAKRHPEQNAHPVDNGIGLARIERREGTALDQARLDEILPVVCVSHQVRVRQCSEGLRVRPPHQGHTDPVRVALLGEQQDADTPRGRFLTHRRHSTRGATARKPGASPAPAPASVAILGR